MRKYVSSCNMFTVDPITQLYFFKDDDKPKSLLGGICSILIYVAFFIFAVVTYIPIKNREFPKISPPENGLLERNATIYNPQSLVVSI